MSRESELYKDKIEVSLDGRQIFYLFFGGAVIVGLVFVLGVMVGRRVEARGHADRAHVEATVDPLAALDRLESGNGLSFQGSLRGADAPVSDVEKQIAAAAADKKPEHAAAEKKAAEHVEPKAEPKSEPKAEPKTEKAEKAEKKDEPKKAEKKAEPKADAAKDTKEAKADKTEKTEKAEKTEKKDDVAKADDAKKSEKKQKFTLQLSSFKDKAEAEAFLDQVKSAGYQAYVAEGEVDGKQFYRVRMGTYRTVDAANDAKADVEKSLKKSALVTKL